MKRMKRRLIGFPLLTVLLVAALACVTINMYFPEEAVADLSQQIESEVRERAAEIDEEQSSANDQPAVQENADAPDGEPAPHSGLIETLLGIQPALAAGGVAPPEVTNPAIRKIIDSRAARVGKINSYKSKGVIGESNAALLEIRDIDAVDLRSRAEVQRLVKDENADRERLFGEIAAAKNVDRSQLPRIRETYAKTLRSNARPGDWIQTADGSWKRQK